VNKKRIYSEE